MENNGKIIKNISDLVNYFNLCHLPISKLKIVYKYETNFSYFRERERYFTLFSVMWYSAMISLM